MFFALLTKNRERNMATPEETRDRIKEMRDRIFKDSDKDSTQNNIQETSQKNDLAEKKPKVLQTNENPSGDTKPALTRAISRGRAGIFLLLQSGLCRLPLRSLLRSLLDHF